MDPEEPDIDAVLAFARRLGRLGRDVDDAVRIDRIRTLEVLKAAAAAAQAVDAVDLDTSQRRLQRAAGVPTQELGRGVGAQVALARRDSPHRGGRHLGLAKALVHEMPHTLEALRSGRISEWRATIVARETAVLTRADREAVDLELAGHAGALERLERLGDRALAARAKEVAYRLDAHSVVARARRAEGERRVSVRTAPDTMAYLTALLPVRQAVSVQVALQRAADAGRSSGDARGRGQLMADTLVAAVVGHQGAAPQVPASDVAVRLVMTDRALLDGGAEPARLEGHGPVPSSWARDLVATSLEDGARVFLTRLFTDDQGALVAVESRARVAPKGLADLIRTRDGGTCRTQWCDAPVRHVDHVLAYADGGRTTADQLQGLCEACNYAKQAPGWRAEVVPVVATGDVEAGSGASSATGTHTVRTTTPTGHVHDSYAPPMVGSARRAPTGERCTAEGPGRPSGDALDRGDPGSPIEELLWQRLCLSA